MISSVIPHFPHPSRSGDVRKGDKEGLQIRVSVMGIILTKTLCVLYSYSDTHIHIYTVHIYICTHIYLYLYEYVCVRERE